MPRRPAPTPAPAQLLVPKFLKENPSAQKSWDAYAAKSKAFSVMHAAKAARGSNEKELKNKDVGPDVYMMDVRLTGWTRSDSEWTAPSVTGSVTTLTDNGFQLHIAGMRLHASHYNEYQIIIDDGSIPLQYYQTQDDYAYPNQDYPDSYDRSTISQKFQTTWLYRPESFDNGIGGDGWIPNFSKLVVTVLEQDSTSNAARKTRLDFYRDFLSDELLAVQIIIENLDKGSYIETNVRFNLSDAEVNYITNNTGRIDPNYTDTFLTLWSPRAFYFESGTIARYDASQVYGWDYSEQIDWEVDWDEYNSSHNFFEGVNLTRRIPYSALTTSLFFPRLTSTVTSTAVAASDVKNRDNWIITLGIVVAVLMLVVFSRVYRK